MTLLGFIREVGGSGLAFHLASYNQDQHSQPLKSLQVQCINTPLDGVMEQQAVAGEELIG
jgi:hypothetical protein